MDIRAHWRSVICCTCLLTALVGAGGPAPAGASTQPIQHVFIIVLENEDANTTFGAASQAPYLAQTLTAAGAYLPNYYSIGHASNDNYIALISGQPPNFVTQADCFIYADFVELPFLIGPGSSAIPAGYGCVYPHHVQTLANQLTAAGKSWKGYMEDMGNDPSRESATCGHPGLNAVDNTQVATPTDQYAARHDPFVYFHSIIDDAAYCAQHVVNLQALPADLQQIATTPNLVFITPNLCDDGHDRPCANGDAGGLAQADSFLRAWVPQITASPAFRQDGLLIITFDESASSDAACCNEQRGPNTLAAGENGPGGGAVGAVMLSPFIKPGTVSETPYNHYALLRSLEQIYGLGYLGYAGASGLQSFGADVFTNN